MKKYLHFLLLLIILKSNGQVIPSEENTIFENHINKIIKDCKLQNIDFDLFDKKLPRLKKTEQVFISWKEDGNILVGHRYLEYDKPDSDINFIEHKYYNGYFFDLENTKIENWRYSNNIDSLVVIKKFRNDILTFERRLRSDSLGFVTSFERIDINKDGSKSIKIIEYSNSKISNTQTEGTMSIHNMIENSKVLEMYYKFIETKRLSLNKEYVLTIGTAKLAQVDQLFTGEEEMVRTFDDKNRVIKVEFPKKKKVMKISYRTS